MKKAALLGIAVGMAGIIGANNGKAVVLDDSNTLSKEIKAVSREERKRKHKKSLLDPTPFDFKDNVDTYIEKYHSPFYNPKKSERVKNKLNRRRYNKNRNKHK